MKNIAGLSFLLSVEQDSQVLAVTVLVVAVPGVLVGEEAVASEAASEAVSEVAEALAEAASEAAAPEEAGRN